MRCISVIWFATLLCSCIPNSDSERCGDGYYYENDNCFLEDTGSDSNIDTDTDTIVDPEQWIGSSCSCDGEECDQMGVPLPNAGTIVGCNDVPAGWTGADRVCMRSYTGGYSYDMFFANGFCSLMAVDCTGDEAICNGAAMGDYGAMAECPAGSALIDGPQDVQVMSLSATLDTKLCAPICEGDEDCRTGEHDPILDETAQYQCVDEQGVKFCYDPRSLPAGYTVEEF